MEWKGKYFTLEELTSSPTARRLKIDNTPSPKVVANLQALVAHVLDPLRVMWGSPIIVTSGYRCALLNKAVGGASQSQHVLGQAADIRTVSDSRDDNLALLRCLVKAGLPFDKLISEYADSKHRPDWIHVSYSSLLRGLTFTCRGGNYIKGIRL